MEDKPRMSVPHHPFSTVYFIGNGVLRVPSWTAGSESTVRSERSLPSWHQYMVELWDLVKTAQGRAGTRNKKGLKRSDFIKLSAPRQAEWFDRQVMPLLSENQTQKDAAALRLHLLGRTFHSVPGVLTNELVQRLSRVILRPFLDSGSRRQIVDVMTTNLDCSLEQNIALAAEEILAAEHGHARNLEGLALDVKAGLDDSAVWCRRGSQTSETSLIRVWKLHGCLRDLRSSMAHRKEDILATLHELTREPVREEPFAGHVPESCLAQSILENWTLRPQPSRSRMPFTGVFSQTEYFRMMNLLIGQKRLAPPRSTNLATFRQLLQERPMMFVGYGLAEVDVDIVGALHLFRPRQGVRRWSLKDGSPDLDPSEAERLQQMGIDWWGFHLPPVAFCRLPEDLRLAARHEWRHREKDHWGKELTQLSAETWLAPQVEALEGLLATDRPRASPRTSRPLRLVAAGLGSIWHGFTLLRSSDFPSPRRASARFIAVDHQVPGGSGLVPIMVAAALAGPSAAGQLQFLSNIPDDWSGWPEVQELCLSAGVSVHPFPPPLERSKIPLVGRTSHVLYFDDEREDASTTSPRQRFIMDVQSFTRPPDIKLSASRLEKIAVPKVSIPADLAARSENVLLFADKEVDLGTLGLWKGPIVFETGATGDELVQLPPSVRPSVWTAGIGSFFRTLTLLAGREVGPEQIAGGAEGVLQHLDSHPVLCRLTACDESLRRDYLCRLLGFNSPIWAGGFTHAAETAYGKWLRDRWLSLAQELCSLLGIGSENPGGRLARDREIGRGALTTVHEAGLMGLWQIGEKGYVSVVSSLDSNDGRLMFQCHAKMADHVLEGPLPPQVLLTVNEESVKLSVEGCASEVKLDSQRSRRNTLAAGDAVRGCLSYGLSRLASRESDAISPSHLAHVLHAACILASLKCYTGSFVNFLTVITRLRQKPLWKHLWGPAVGHGSR